MQTFDSSLPADITVLLHVCLTHVPIMAHSIFFNIQESRFSAFDVCKPIVICMA